MRKDTRQIAEGGMRTSFVWVLHLTKARIVIWRVITAGIMSLWVVLLASYFTIALSKVRTFLQHRDHEKAGSHTVVIE